MDERVLKINIALSPLTNITMSFGKHKPPVNKTKTNDHAAKDTKMSAARAEDKKNAKKDVMKFAFSIQECTFNELFGELETIVPDAVPEGEGGMSFMAQVSAQLGEEVNRHINHLRKHTNGDDEAKLGMIDVGAFLRDNLGTLTMPETHINLLISRTESDDGQAKRSWAMSVVMNRVNFFGIPIELALFVQKGKGSNKKLRAGKKSKDAKAKKKLAKKKGWAIFFGFKMDRDTRARRNEHSAEAMEIVDTIKGFMGDPMRRIGFVVASSNIWDVQRDSSIVFAGTDFQRKMPFLIANVWPGPQAYTESDLTVPGAKDTVIYTLVSAMDMIGGSDAGQATGERNSLAGTIASQNTPEMRKRATLIISISELPEFCFAKDFKIPVSNPIKLGDAVRLRQLIFQVCIKLASLSISLSFEASAEIDLQADIDIDISEQNVTLVAELGIEFEIGLTGMTLEAFFAAKLATANQIWHNPFGLLPKLGIIFPIGAGIGVTVNFPSGIPYPSYFEFEAGFIGCASKIYTYDDDDIPGSSALSAQAALGSQNKNYSSKIIRYGDTRKVGYGRRYAAAALGEAHAAIPGLELVYCGADEDGELDPYGKEPTVFKIAIIIDVTDKKIGVMVIMRNIYPVRLILMFFPFIPKSFKSALIGMRDILDLITLERYEVTLNPSPIPLYTRGGTEIPHGLKIDIVNFNFFKIIKFRRVYFHISLMPPGLECHIFIDPFAFKIGGITFFSLTGLEGTQKRNSKAKQAEAARARAEQEAIALAKVRAGATIKQLREGKVEKWNSVCGEQECMTCAKQLEGTGTMMLACGTLGSVITQVHFAQWAVAGDMADWHLSDAAGMCGHPEFGLSKESNHSSVAVQNAEAFNFKGVRQVRMKNTLRVVRERCLGLPSCNLMPLRSLFGQVRHARGERHALAVAVNCSDDVSYRESMTTTLIESYGLKCTPPMGCPTCMKTDRHKETPSRLECYGDGFIADIVDAVYGAEEEQPSFFFDPTAASCNLTKDDRTIPTGNMCRASRSRAIREVKRRCLGRQNCAFSTADIEKMFPNDPCPGLPKRLTVIGTCMKSQIPLAVEDFLEDGHFGFVQLESRRLSYTSPAISTRDGYQLRVTFQSSASAYQQRYLYSSVDAVWGVDKRADSHTRRIHRIMATMSLPDYMADGANYFSFRIRGRKFWDKGGVLSVVQKSNERDFCGEEGTGCDIKGCVPSKGEPADSCTFHIRLPGEAQYQIYLYGITADEDPGASVTLEWKPPSTCWLYDEGCLDALKPERCLKLSHEDMPWQPMKAGKFPWIDCRSPFAAEVMSIEAELKPFCMDGDGYDGELRKCWPFSALQFSQSIKFDAKDGKVRNSCEGSFSATEAFSDSVMFAVKSAAVSSVMNVSSSQPQRHIHAIVDENDACRMTLDPTVPTMDVDEKASGSSPLGATLAKDMTKNRVAHMRFEEGPCGGGGRADREVPPEERLRCTSKTYGGSGVSDVNAVVYTYPTDGMGESDAGIVDGNKLAPDSTGALFAHPAHSGNFAAHFSDNVYVKSRPLVAVNLPTKGVTPREGQKLTKGTISFWFKKFGAVAVEGETLLSW